MSGRRWRAAVVVAALASVAGCGVVRDNAGEPALAPAALSVDAAKTVFAHYEAVNNTANTHLDATLIATIEGGSRLAMDQASYRHARATKGKFTAFHYADPAFYLPRQAGYPRWFLVSARPGKKPEPQLMLFLRARAGDPWLLVATPDLASKKKLPELAKDADGFVQPVPGGSSVKAAATAYLDYLNAGPGSRNAGRFAADPLTKASFTDLAETRRRLGPQVTVTYTATLSADPIVALRTRDGGTLVLFGSVQHQEFRVTDPDTTLSTEPGVFDGLGATPNRPYRDFLDVANTIEQALVIPPKGRPAKLEVIGYDDGVTKVTGV